MSRETTHLVIETIRGRYYIVSSLCDRRDTTVISVERYTGRLLYTAYPGIDLFPTTKDALNHISMGKKIFKTVTRCHALLGYFIISGVAYLLLATKVNNDLTLPPNHRVYTIKETYWIKISLGYPVTSSPGEQSNAELLAQFALNGLHYYCETLDLTRRFPSSHAVHDPDFEFVWNEFITYEFRHAGLERWCCVMLEGMAIGKSVSVSGGSSTNSNRSSVDISAAAGSSHASLSAAIAAAAQTDITGAASPTSGPEDPERSTRPRSGAVTQLPLDNSDDTATSASTALDAASPRGERVHICLVYRRSSKHPGTRYLSRGLNEKAGAGNEYEVEQIVYRKYPGYANMFVWSTYYWRRGTVPIHWTSYINNAVTDADIVISSRPYELVDRYYKSLVDRYGSNARLTILNLLRTKAHHADEGMLTEHYEESVTIVKKLMSMDINFINYDWHSLVKHEGLEVAVEGLWDIIGSTLREQNITSGLMRTSPKGRLLDLKTWRQQYGYNRINCADSLDRTNLCSFFIALHVLAEQCREIGVPQLFGSSALTAAATEQWNTIGYKLEYVKLNFDSDLLAKYAEMFVTAGDVCATLFTNTGAMHTAPLRDFAKHLPPAPNNTLIIVDRRVQNVMNDKKRQIQYEMFLGLKWNKYFPFHVRTHRVNYLTPYPSFIFKNIPSEISLAKLPEENSLLRQGAKLCWICPRDFDYIELNIYLPYFCRVTELALTVRHGLSEMSSPGKMDVFVGTHLDDCQVGFQEMMIPRCEDNTKLLYTLPHQISGVYHRNVLYDFYDGAPSNLMRVVRLTFYDIPPSFFMTLGYIQVFGFIESSASGRYQKEFYLELQYEPANEIIDAVYEIETIDDATVLDEETKRPALHHQSTENTGVTVVTAPVIAPTPSDAPESPVLTPPVKFAEDFDALLAARTVEQEAATADAPKPASGDAIYAGEEADSANQIVETAMVDLEASDRNTSAVDLTAVEEGAAADETPALGAEDLASEPNTPNSAPGVQVTPSTQERSSIADAATASSGPTRSTSEDSLALLNAHGRNPSLLQDYFARSASEDNLSSFLERFAPMRLHELKGPRGSVILAPIPVDERRVLTYNAKDQYLKFVTSKCPTPAHGVSFLDALELDLARLALGLESSERDQVLIENGFKVYKFNPNRFVYKRDEYVEKDQRAKNKLVAYKCHLCKTGIKLRKFTCHCCRKVFCKTCTHKDKMKIIEYAWQGLHQVCIECAGEIKKQEQLLVDIKRYNEERVKQLQQTRKDDEFYNLLAYSYPPASLSYRSYAQAVYMSNGRLAHEILLSEFPSAGVLASVPTADNSPPIESILFPPELVPDKFWFAPENTKSISVILVFPCYANISRMILQVDKLGYHDYDLPQIKVSSAERLPQFTQHPDWYLLPAYGQGYHVQPVSLGKTGPMVVPPGRRFEYVFPLPSRGTPQTSRLLKLEISLPAEQKDKHVRRMLHLGRLLVFGKVVPVPDTGLSMLPPAEQTKYDNILRIPYRTTRQQINSSVKLDRESRSVDLLPMSGSGPQAQYKRAYISGFRLLVDHGREGIDSYVQTLRVTVLAYNDQTGVTHQYNAGTYTIPRVASGTLLSFEFDRTFENASCVRFEFLSNYGAHELVMGRVSLFVTSIA